MFPDESNFYIGDNDLLCVGQNGARGTSSTNLSAVQTLWNAAGVMICGTIFYDSRSTFVVILYTMTAYLYVSPVIKRVLVLFMKTIQEGGFNSIIVSSYHYCNPTFFTDCQYFAEATRPLHISPMTHIRDITEQ